MDKHTHMQAVVCHGPKDYRLERIGNPRRVPMNW
jgi:L-iditol 2-dehydrogenase